MSVRVCTRALARPVLALLVASLVPSASFAQSSFKVAYWNIQSGKGEPALPGHPVTFYDTTNCTDPSKPINGWYVGLVQSHLIKSIGSDPGVIALGLGEAWASVCASPENVRRVLGWKARSSERNGVALVARHGFAGAEEWVQLDTSRNNNPPDTMWVLRVPVCMDAACSQTINVFSAHWMGTGTYAAEIYDYQAQQTVAFLKRAGGANHVLVGDLNVWEGTPECGKTPQPAGLSRLRDAGYIDGWPAANGAAEGFTGMTNRVGCGTPEGYPFGRIDYAWTPPGVYPLSMTRFGMEPPGDEQPSDHYGIIAEYPWPGAPPMPDTTAPVASLTSPAQGYVALATTNIAVSANDNVGVTRVDILEDGAAAHVLADGTWQVACTHLAAKAPGTHTLQARAFDASGNYGLSSIVSILVPSTTPAPTTPTAGDIVLYAKNASVLTGNWQIVSDAAAAGQARVWNRDLGAAKVPAALASPLNYFELTFNAEAGRPYRLWLRGLAERNHWGNDSVYVQFSGATTSSGAALYRIGTTSGATVNIEDGASAGLSGWGWQDNGYGAGVLGPLVYFAVSGPQTIRIQNREDGISIDQILLSPGTYLTTSPGALKNDSTILTAGSGTAPSVGEIVIRASSATALGGAWQKITDPTAAGGVAVRHPDAGGAKLAAALASPANYVEFTFQAEAGRKYRLWIRGRADRDYWGNDSVFVQFSGSVDASGAATYRIGTSSAAMINLEDAANSGLAGWGWQDNGYGAGILGPLVSFGTTGTQKVRIQTREDGLRFDQVVLSSGKYMTTAPGALKNDATIIP